MLCLYSDSTNMTLHVKRYEIESLTEVCYSIPRCYGNDHKLGPTIGCISSSQVQVPHAPARCREGAGDASDRRPARVESVRRFDCARSAGVRRDRHPTPVRQLCGRLVPAERAGPRQGVREQG